MLLTILSPPTPTLFPYTTLFRSTAHGACGGRTSGRGTCRRLPGRRRGRPRTERRRPRRRRRRRPTLSARDGPSPQPFERSEEHTSELQSLTNLVCRLLLEKKKKK